MLVNEESISRSNIWPASLSENGTDLVPTVIYSIFQFHNKLSWNYKATHFMPSRKFTEVQVVIREKYMRNL